MRRLGWYAVSAMVAAMIAGSVLLLAANLYVQSQAVQQRIHQALTATLHMPVTVCKTTLTPWEGLRIDGLTARPDHPASEAEAAAPDFLKAESFRVRFALLPLLRRQFVVTLLWLDKPQLAWAQDPDGRWQFPPGRNAVRHKKPSTRDEPPRSPGPVAPLPDAPAPETAQATPATPAPAVPKEHEPRAPEGFSVALDRFKMRHGTIDFLNAKHRPVGELEDVNLDGHLSDTRRATGTVWCDKAQWSHTGLMLTQFHSSFAYDQEDGFTVNDGKAAFAGGTVAARTHFNPREADAPFSAECRVEKVDLKQLLEEAGSRLELIQGNLEGKVVFNGRSDRPDSRQATGRFELLDARLKNFPLFQTLGDAMHIEDLSHLQFKKAQLDCQLDGAVLAVEPLLLVSNDLKITAQGRYLTDDDHLDLHGRLVIDEAVSRQLPDFISEQFKPCTDAEAPGSRFVDFDVTGPLNNPTSNLYNRVLGDPMMGLLHGFLSPKQKTPKEKTPKHRPAAPPPAAPAGNASTP